MRIAWALVAALWLAGSGQYALPTAAAELAGAELQAVVGTDEGPAWPKRSEDAPGVNSGECARDREKRTLP